MHPTLDPATLQRLRALVPKTEQDSLIDEVIDNFLTDTATQLAALRTALAAGDLQACRCAAQRIQGSAGTVGAKQLMHLGEELEFLAHVGARVHLRVRLEAAEAEYGRVVQGLARERDPEAELRAA